MSDPNATNLPSKFDLGPIQNCVRKEEYQTKVRLRISLPLPAHSCDWSYRFNALCTGCKTTKDGCAESWSLNCHYIHGSWSSCGRKNLQFVGNYAFGGIEHHHEHLDALIGLQAVVNL